MMFIPADVCGCLLLKRFCWL